MSGSPSLQLCIELGFSIGRRGPGWQERLGDADGNDEAPVTEDFHTGVLDAGAPGATDGPGDVGLLEGEPAAAHGITGG